MKASCIKGLDYGFLEGLATHDPLETPEILNEVRATRPVRTYGMVLMPVKGRASMTSAQVQVLRENFRLHVLQMPQLALPAVGHSPSRSCRVLSLADMASRIDGQRDNEDYETAKLTTSRTTNVFRRTTAIPVEQSNESKVTSFRAKLVYFHILTVSASHVAKLTRQDDVNAVSFATELTNKKANEIGSHAQHYIFQVIRNGMRGMMSLFGFNNLANSSEVELKALLSALYELNPLLHTLSVFAPVADAVDFIGILTDATYPGCEQEQEKRIKWRAIAKDRVSRVVCWLGSIRSTSIPTNTISTKTKL